MRGMTFMRQSIYKMSLKGSNLSQETAIHGLHYECYTAGRKITPKGIMVHSTGANNPNLKRYVGPDDGLLGKKQYKQPLEPATY